MIETLALIEACGRSNRLHLRYEHASDTARALVFLHEGLGAIALWRSFPDDLRASLASRPTTVSYSRAGYGWSDVLDTARPTSYMHDEARCTLPAVLDHLGIARPVLVGHSDGASIALIYAGLGHPVGGLVLIAPHVFVEDCTLEAIAAARLAFARGDLRDRLARHHRDVDATFSGWNDVWLSPAFGAWSIEALLPAIDAPVLLVQGSDDPYGTMGQIDAIAGAVTGPVERLVVDGGGHAPHLTHRDAVVATASTFVDRLDDHGGRAAPP